MANVSVQFSNGTSHTFENVPDGINEQQIVDRALQDFGLPVVNISRQAPVAAKKERSWGDVASGAVTSFIPSAVNVGKSVVEAVSSPVQTAKGLLDVGAGALQNILPERLVQAIGEDKESRQKASAVADFYKQRYGSMEGFKEALATDPAGVLADVSSIATGGGAALAKVPTLAKAGQVVSTVGRSVDPLVAALKGTQVVGSAIGKGVGNIATKYAGLASGVGEEPIKQAYQAGRVGGEQGASFIENLRGNVPMQDVLETAKADLAEMGRLKKDAYRSNMQAIKDDKTVLGFDDVNKAFAKTLERTEYKGQARPGVSAQVEKAREIVDNWKNLDPAEYHTPEGFDFLKQQVGDVLESIPFEQANARAAVGDIYRSIKETIGKQAPKYAEVMKDYSESSDLIREIERSLSLGKKSAADTGMRKLQSLMRNNVNTSYGNRLQLAQELEKAGGQQIMPALAGQALNEWTPRGLQRASAIPTSIVAGSVATPVAGVANLLASSPRVVGETAYKAGQLARGLRAPGRVVENMLSPNQQQMLQNVNPRVLANILYQANQPKEQQ